MYIEAPAGQSALRDQMIILTLLIINLINSMTKRQPVCEEVNTVVILDVWSTNEDVNVDFLLKTLWNA